MTQVHMVVDWYIDVGGRVEGPVSVAELSARAAGGTLSPTDSVSADRVTWVPANTVPGLTFPPRPRQPLMETVISGSVHAAASDPGPDLGPATVPVVTVAGYKILDTLGAGACGVVYKALQEKLNRVVALKTVLMPDKATPELIGRFQREAVALARLQHPNIVAVYDSGLCETPMGQAFFAMELLDGEDLGARIDRAGPLDEPTVWHVVRQTAAALAHATTHGIVHRDVKPANLFLIPPPTGFPLPAGVPMVKVTDFGLALSRAEGDQRKSVAGTLLGTPVYMAPEQFSGSDVDVRADIYGLGCTVYHALTGAPPFDGRTVWDVMMKKSAAPARLAPPVSSETADLVASMLAISPDERPRDYTDLLARIDALPCMDAGPCSVRLPTASGRTVAPPAREPLAVSAPPPAPRAQRWWVYALAAVALLGVAVGVAAVVGAFNSRTGGPQRQGAGPELPPPPPFLPPPPPKYHPRNQVLYKPGSLVSWVPDGGPWAIERDDEQAPALTGSGAVVRRFDPPVSFRVTLSIDPHEARVAEVIVATADGPEPGAAQWLIRLDRAVKGKGGGTVAFGKRVAKGPFEPVGSVLPLPTARELVARGARPYLDLKYERAGGKLTATFRDQELGDTPDAGLKTTELRLNAVGGPIRIDAAALEELAEKK